MIGRLTSPFRDRHFWGGFGALAARGIVLSAAAEPPFDPLDYDLAAWLDTTAEGATVEPGFDADFLASVPNPGSLGSAFTQATPSLRPLREREKGAGYFREWRHLVIGEAADWTDVHNGTTKTLITFVATLSLSVTAHVMGTFSGTSNNSIGFNLRAGTAGNLVLRVNNGSGSAGVNIATGNGGISAGVPFYASILIDGTSVSLFVGGALVGTGTIPNPSSSAPDHTLTIGAQPNASAPIDGWFPEALIFQGSEIPDREKAEAFLAAKHDLSTLTIPSPCQLYTTLDASEVVYESGTEGDIKRVQTVPNHGSAGGTMTQGTASNRPFAVDFMAGRVMYFPGGGERLASSLAASAWTWLHNGTGKGKIGFAFRLESFTGTFNRICGTRDTTAANIGFAAMVRNDGRIRVDITNGSDVSTIQSTTGLVEVGETYRVAIEIDEDDVTISLNGTQVATGTITSPSSSNPQSTLTLGSRPDGAEPFHGFLSELYVSQDDGSGPMLSNEEIDALLQRHSFDDTIDEAIAMHVAAGDLEAAFTPESIQESLEVGETLSGAGIDPPTVTLSGDYQQATGLVIEVTLHFPTVVFPGGPRLEIQWSIDGGETWTPESTGNAFFGSTWDVPLGDTGITAHFPGPEFATYEIDGEGRNIYTADLVPTVTWDDVSGNGHHKEPWASPSSEVTKSTLGSLDAVRLHAIDTEFAILSGGTALSGDAFTVVQYGQAADEGSMLWSCANVEEPDERHRWIIDSGDHVVERTDGTLSPSSTPIEAADTQRFFAHVFRGDAFNRVVVDDDFDEPDLTTDPIGPFGDAVNAAQGTGGTCTLLLAYELRFTRALNPGELARLWAAMDRKANA